MKKTIIILIPPSEGKAPGGEGKPIQPNKDAREMLKRLHGYDGEWGKLLGVKGKALDAALEANASILKSPTLPAIERYSGVVYDGIDYASMKASARRTFDERVRIVSALFGLVQPQDLIPNYKLKIDKLNAAAYWKPIIVKQLKDSFVIDLLPQAHHKAVGYPDGIRVDFVCEKNGKRKPAGHFGKLIKGRFVRWLCENKLADPKRFSSFDEDGYRWNGECFIKVEC
ncbi:MAG: peroxide stress protein YaaA [Candidatus Hinthialibacter antarcticus]|nr:peroxide stress protein YaaA [Candidatus Hinthialibacter antarcticus]